MNDPREIECARLAWSAKQQVEKRQLGELHTRQFESPLSGVSLWPKDRGGSAQLLFLPIAWLLALVLAVLTPFAYVLHRIDIRKQVNALRARLREPFDPSKQEASPHKTIETLWESCALPGGLGLDESSALLRSWLETLYGDDVARAINPEERARDIAKQQIEANRPYYEGEDAPHFYFELPIDSLVRTLSEDLPPYSKPA